MQVQRSESKTRIAGLAPMTLKNMIAEESDRIVSSAVDSD
jgi:hypothetical protein